MDARFKELYHMVDPEKQLLTAVSCNMEDRLVDLIKEGVDVNATLLVQGGNKALHIAAHKGHWRCMELLLEASADPDATNDSGFIPLVYALRHGHVECARRLLSCHKSVYNDIQLAWMATSSNGGHLWKNYQEEIIELMLVATPRCDETYSREICRTFFQNFIPVSLLKAFCLSGHTLTQEELRRILPKLDDKTATWLKGQCTSVRPLLQHARLAIRKELLPSPLGLVHQLPLPPKVQDYLLLDDIYE